jgi:hypothetical protein
MAHSLWKEGISHEPNQSCGRHHAVRRAAERRRRHPSAAWQARVGGAVVLLAIGMGWGAAIPGDAGYGGVGPNFLPWVCAVVLAICGLC